MTSLGQNEKSKAYFAQEGLQRLYQETLKKCTDDDLHHNPFNSSFWSLKKKKKKNECHGVILVDSVNLTKWQLQFLLE